MDNVEWSPERYTNVLRALQKTKLFAGISAKDGYSLRAPLNFGRRMAIRKLYNEARYLFDEHGEGKDTRLVPAKTVAVYTSRDKKKVKTAKVIAGLKSGKWSKVLMPVMAGTKRVSIDIDTANQRARVAYPEWHLEQFITRVDGELATFTTDLEREETTTVDELVAKMQREAREKLGDLEGDGTFFRINTIYGDVSAGKYAPTTLLDTVINDYIPKLVQRYARVTEDDDGKEHAELQLFTGVSAWRKTKGYRAKKENKEYERHNFNRDPERKRKMPVYRFRAVKGRKKVMFDDYKAARAFVKLNVDFVIERFRIE